MSTITRSDIANALRGIDLSLITSGYASGLIGHQDTNFINYLNDHLTRSEKKLLVSDPNSMAEFLEDLGIAFYNYYYLGNPGYEGTLFGY